MWHGAWFCLGGVTRGLNGSPAGVKSDKKEPLSVYRLDKRCRPRIPRLCRRPGAGCGCPCWVSLIGSNQRNIRPLAARSRTVARHSQRRFFFFFPGYNPRSGSVCRAFLRKRSCKIRERPPWCCQPGGEPFYLAGAEWSAKRARPPVSFPLANGITVIGVGDTAAHFGLFPRQHFNTPFS